MARDDAARFRYPTSDEDLIPFLDRRWTEGVNFRRAADIRAFWNIAFYHGYQWLYESDRSETTLRRLPVDADDPNAPVMLTVNKVRSRVDRAIAEVTSNYPGIEVRPVSEEDSDYDAAKVGTRISASEDRRMGMDTLCPRLYTWVVPAGWAFLQLTWNTEDGKYVGDDPKLMAEGIKRALYEGNCEATVRPHYEVVLDPMCVDAWDARWGLTQSALTPEEVYEQYGCVIEKPINLMVISDELGQLSTDRSLETQNRIAVRQFWLRPNVSRDCPEGMVFTWAGQTVLEARKPWPYKHTRRLPLIQFNYHAPQGGYMGRTPCSDLIDLQIDYNRARSLEADIESRMMPKAFYQEGSMQPENISARYEWVPYLPGAQPPVVPPVDLAFLQAHEMVMKRAEFEMDEAMSQPDAARGSAAGTSAAASVMAQQEAAKKPYTLPAKELARALEHFGWYRLMLIRQYWREERLVRTWSRAGTLTVERFRNADVDRELDVEVRAESILPRSKAAMAQLATQFMQMQVPGFDVRHYIRMIDLPGTDVMTEVFDADERHAERENQYLVTRGRKLPAMPKGGESNEAEYTAWLKKLTETIPQVGPRDNHPVHIETHRLHMISVEFESYPDKVKALFEAHISQHEMLQQAQLSQQMAAQGGPAGAGAMPGQGGQPAVQGVPSIEDFAGMNGGPGGGMSEPGVPPGIDPDAAAGMIGA